jgi:hypothetical protein
MSVTQGGRTDFNGTVSVNNFASANASACLDLTSTTQGALLPRMNTTQQNAISTPATGLMLYNTSNNLLSIYNGSVFQYPSPVLISSQTLGSNTASITFSAIPQTFNTLRIIGMGAMTNASANQLVCMRFNGDTGNNYNRGFIYNNNNSSAVSNTATTSFGYCGLFAGSTAAANSSGMFECIIPFYANTIFLKTANSNSSSVSGAAAGYNGNFLCTWNSTAAITSITIADYVGSSNMVTGTTINLYGQF